MNPRYVRTEIRRSIGECMNYREEKKWEISISREEKKKSSNKSDGDSRNDIFTVFAVLFHPDRWYTENIPDRKSDKPRRHEVFLCWNFFLSMLHYLMHVESMIFLPILSTECNPKKFFCTHKSRKNMCFKLFVGWDFSQNS